MKAPTGDSSRRSKVRVFEGKEHRKQFFQDWFAKEAETRGLSQQQFAKRMGITQSGVSRMFNGVGYIPMTLETWMCYAYRYRKDDPNGFDLFQQDIQEYVEALWRDKIDAWSK